MERVRRKIAFLGDFFHDLTRISRLERSSNSIMLSIIAASDNEIYFPIGF